MNNSLHTHPTLDALAATLFARGKTGTVPVPGGCPGISPGRFPTDDILEGYRRAAVEQLGEIRARLGGLPPELWTAFDEDLVHLQRQMEAFLRYLSDYHRATKALFMERRRDRLSACLTGIIVDATDLQPTLASMPTSAALLAQIKTQARVVLAEI